MDEIINLINNSILTISEYEKINDIINSKIKHINQNEYSNNLFINIKNYKTDNIQLQIFINYIINIKVSYDYDSIYIYFEYIDYKMYLTVYYDDNCKNKTLEIYKKNNINHYCFYTDHEENFINLLDWHSLITTNELYSFFKYMFNLLQNDLYKW
jgi:hypothetical protein